MRIVNWETVQRPRLIGGLGVVNWVSLAKWIWRFFHEPNALWHDFIVAKCYSSFCVLSTVVRVGPHDLLGGLFHKLLV